MAAWKACFLPRGSQEHSPLCLPCCSKILRCWKNWQPMATIQTSRLLGINFALPPFFCVMQSSVQLSEEGKNPTSLQSIAAAALRESRSNKGTDMHRHTRYSPCSERMASCMSWLSLWVIVKAQEGVVEFFFCIFSMQSYAGSEDCHCQRNSHGGCPNRGEKTHLHPKQPANVSRGCEQSHDSRLIRTDVRHKQLKFDLNIYKNLEISYVCYVWEGDGVIYNLCTCCSHCLWLLALTWLSHKPGGSHHFGPVSFTHGHMVCGQGKHLPSPPAAFYWLSRFCSPIEVLHCNYSLYDGGLTGVLLNTRVLPPHDPTARVGVQPIKTKAAAC